MNPVSPVMPGSEPIEILLGKNQSEYIPLPAVYMDTAFCTMVTRWRPTAEERQKLIDGGDVILQTVTFRNPYQPVNLQVCMPDEAPILIEDFLNR